jgi:hypothetical protein
MKKVVIQCCFQLKSLSLDKNTIINTQFSKKKEKREKRKEKRKKKKERREKEDRYEMIEFSP